MVSPAKSPCDWCTSACRSRVWYGTAVLIALVWLALTSDTNGVAAHGVADPPMDALAAAEPTV